MNSSYFLVTLLLCLIFATSAALAAEKPSAQTSGQVPNSDGFSLGLVLGDPTGITQRTRLSPRNPSAPGLQPLPRRCDVADGGLDLRCLGFPGWYL